MFQSTPLERNCTRFSKKPVAATKYNWYVELRASRLAHFDQKPGLRAADIRLNSGDRMRQYSPAPADVRGQAESTSAVGSRRPPTGAGLTGIRYCQGSQVAFRHGFFGCM